MAISPAAAEAPPQCSSAITVANFVSAKLRRDKKQNNYKRWKAQMLCLVQSQGLAGFIDGQAPPPQNDDIAAWRRTDLLVKGWILGALSDEVLDTVVNLDSARDIWLHLETKFTESVSAAPPPPPPPPTVAHQEKEWHEYLPLYRAAMSGEWDAAAQILEQDPDAIRARVAYTLETALHVAVGIGKSTNFVCKLVDLMSDEEVAITDGLGYNPLHVAALTGNRRAAEILVNRLPDLLYVSCRSTKFPVHVAAEAGHRQTLEFLISRTRDDLPTSPFAGDSGVRLLVTLIRAEFYDVALDLVETYPHLARRKPLSGDIPALKAMAFREATFCVEAQLNFWERLLYLCTKAEMKIIEPQPLDIEKQTCCSIKEANPPSWRKVVSSLCKVFKHLVPCIKRVHEKNLRRQLALRLVKCLCKHMESLTQREASAIYSEAMLTAARLGIYEIIEIIVGTFPQAIYAHDVATKHNFLHMAITSRCEKFFNLIYQTTNHRNHYSNIIDSFGNNILHLAATLAPPHKLNSVSGAALQMQREIQWFKAVDKLITPLQRQRSNKVGKTPEMIFTERHRELKVEGEKWMKDTANSCTIAAALIATVVFAAAITVPGGNESNSGYPLFSKSSAFTIFAVSDAVSLFTSTTSLLMFLSIMTSRYAEEDFLYALPKRLCIGLVTLFLSILFMMIAFSSTVYLVFGRKNAWVLIAVGALASLPISSFVLLQFPLLIAVISSTHGRGIFVKQSDRPFP